MKRHSSWLFAAVVGCGLVNSNTLSYEYAFDPQEFMQKLGDDKTMQTVPMQACDPTAAPGTTADQCAQLQAALPTGSQATISCDATTRMCAAVIDVTLPYPVDLSMQSLPAPVVQYGVDHVGIEKIAYWIMTNTVNVDVPAIDLYVSSSGETNPNNWKLVGTVAKLPARSAACADSADPKGDPAAMGAAVCDVSLSDAGQTALAGFVKDYKTPFQFIAHTKIVAHGGDPLPTGTIAFFVRPTVAFYVLK